jgi:polyferredoxin
MARIGRPDGLIGYDTDINMVRRAKGLAPVYRLVRPRTILYAAIIALVGGVMLYALATRPYAGLDVIHDRNPQLVRLSDGSVRNGYTVRLLNKRPVERAFNLSVDGLPAGARVEAFGATTVMGVDPVLNVGPDITREVRVVVVVPPRSPLAETSAVTFRIVDATFGERIATGDFFKMPKPEGDPR